MPKTKKPGVEIDQEYEVVSLTGDEDRLREHPQNPKRGKTEVIDESIDKNGWFGAVVAQKSTGYILAGNHRYRAAVERGAEAIPVIWRDVDDDTALRICLADNRTSELGEMDEEALEAALESLENLAGTGYGLEEVIAAEEAKVNGTNVAGSGEEEIPDDVYRPEFGVMVQCDSEEHQRQVYEQLQVLGLTIRVVAV